MPHCIVEYTANLRGDVDIPALLGTIAAKYRNSDGVFPVHGIRVRAIELADYVVNDGRSPNSGFVHATCVIAPGRPEAFLRQFFSEMFEAIEAQLAPAAERRFIGLSLDVVVGTEARSYKVNLGRAG